MWQHVTKSEGKAHSHPPYYECARRIFLVQWEPSLHWKLLQRLLNSLIFTTRYYYIVTDD